MTRRPFRPVHLAVLVLLVVAMVAVCLRLAGCVPALGGRGRLPEGLEWRDGKILRVRDGMEMVRIPPGSFRMGSDHGNDQERPVHTVTISRAFYLDRHEVTNAQYAAFLNARPPSRDEHPRRAYVAGEKASEFLNPQILLESGRFRSETGKERHPVIWVTWYGAAAYCQWVDGRLPTEAQWEYAARGGLAEAEYAWGNGDRPPAGAGNLADETARRRWPHWTTFEGYDDGFETTSPACALEANGYGACDMVGNVREWVGDWWGGDSYATLGSGAQDPEGPVAGSARVLRGGSWGSNPSWARVAGRGYDDPEISFNDIGFRCVRAPD